MTTHPCPLFPSYFRCTSVHWRWGAKQAMAHTLISMPVWNCLLRMSQTPCTGVAIALFCRQTKERG